MCGWFSLQFIACNLLVEILPADSEYPRTFSFVSARRRQNLRNVSRLELREAHRLVLPPLRTYGRLQTYRKIVLVNSLSVGDDHRTLDNVSELSCISRVVVSRQASQRRLRGALNLSQVLR